MTIRFIAILCLIAASLYITKKRNNDLERAYRLQTGVLSLLLHIKHSMAYRLPMDEILQAYYHDSFYTEGFGKISDTNTLIKMIRDHASWFMYDSFTLSALIDFFQSIGLHSLTDELMLLEQIYETLSGALEEKKNRYLIDKKVNVTLGITVAFMLAILLL